MIINAETRFFTIDDLILENGTTCKSLRVAYQTYGKRNADGSNVVWVFHALTASANIKGWWSGGFGTDNILNEEQDYIVCANLIGSCYGSTGPLDTNPATGQPYYYDFPLFTIRDQVAIFRLLADHLHVKRIKLGVGGSMGACHALEWAILDPAMFANLYLSVCSAKESSWGKAIHTAHRMAIEADQSWGEFDDRAGIQGMKAARAIGMVIYRNHKCYEYTQSDENDTLTEFRAASYQRYQGEKLANRFNAHSYYHLLNSLDTHHVGRGRGSIQNALQNISAQTVIVNIDTDLLYPIIEQEILVSAIPNGILESIESIYGHDGFLIENESLKSIYQKHFMSL